MEHRVIEYPQRPRYISNHWDNLVHYQKNWTYTYEKLRALNAELNTLYKTRDFTVVVAGSYGRMEASTESDLDFFVLFGENECTQEEITAIRNKVLEICLRLEIKSPNIEGVFADAFSVQEILSKIGHKEDDLSRLAQRMLLLMESRAIYNEELYKTVVTTILKKYLDLVIKDPSKEAIFLLNDLIRYFRSIAVNYQYNFWKDNHKWVIRNVKLRHSRILIYAGLLLLITNASKLTDKKYEYFEEHIYLTPIEKIVSVYLDNRDNSYERLLGAYDVFLGKLNLREVREALQVDYEDRYNNPHYAELKVTSDFFISELTRFVMAQKRNWSQQIYEYLIF